MLQFYLMLTNILTASKAIHIQILDIKILGLDLLSVDNFSNKTCYVHICLKNKKINEHICYKRRKEEEYKFEYSSILTYINSTYNCDTGFIRIKADRVISLPEYNFIITFLSEDVKTFTYAICSYHQADDKNLYLKLEKYERDVVILKVEK